MRQSKGRFSSCTFVQVTRAAPQSVSIYDRSQEVGKRRTFWQASEQARFRCAWRRGIDGSYAPRGFGMWRKRHITKAGERGRRQDPREGRGRWRGGRILDLVHRPRRRGLADQDRQDVQRAELRRDGDHGPGSRRRDRRLQTDDRRTRWRRARCLSSRPLYDLGEDQKIQKFTLDGTGTPTRASTPSTSPSAPTRTSNPGS